MLEFTLLAGTDQAVHYRARIALVGAGQQHLAATGLHERLRGAQRVLLSGQPPCLGTVGCEQGGFREQLRPYDVDQGLVRHVFAAARGQHRVDHQRQSGQGACQRPGDRGGAEQADLDHIRPYVAQQAVELGEQRRLALGVQLADIAAVLGGQAGDQRTGVAAMRQRSLDVGLQAGAAGGIVTADKQDLGG